MYDQMIERLADRPIAALLILVGVGMVGWQFHAWWLRRRIRIVQLSTGDWVLQLGRAVAGVWASRKQALHHKESLRRQIGGHV
jgi:hypothetical protein